jgi:WD40 repeat protein
MAANEMAAGDLSTALLHVGQAFGLAPYDESNASFQRLRVGTVIDSSPTLTHFWLSDASINRIEFDRANEFLFVAGDSGLLGRYSLAEDKLSRFTGHIGDVRDIALHEESGRLLSVGGDHTVRLWDLESGQEIRVFDQEADLWCVKFSPDGKMAYSGGGASPEGGSIYRWNLDETDSGNLDHIYPHLEKAWDLEISADGGILAA